MWGVWCVRGWTPHVQTLGSQAGGGEEHKTPTGSDDDDGTQDTGLKMNE